MTGRPGLQPMDPGNAFRERDRRDLAATFREAVDAKTVTDRGPATFDGRPGAALRGHPRARRHRRVRLGRRTGSGRPLGAIERIGDQVRTERLERYERLEPSGAALAALAAP